MTRQERLYNLIATIYHCLIFHPEEASLKLTRFLLMFSVLHFTVGLAYLAQTQAAITVSLLPTVLIFTIMILGFGWCMREISGLITLYAQAQCPLCQFEAPTAAIPLQSRYRLMEYLLQFLGISISSGTFACGSRTTDLSPIIIGLGLFLPVPLILFFRISGLISRIQREIDAVVKLDLTGEELENLATDQLEHAAALAGDIGQHRNLQVINQELHERRRRKHQEAG